MRDKWTEADIREVFGAAMVCNCRQVSTVFELDALFYPTSASNVVREGRGALMVMDSDTLCPRFRIAVRGWSQTQGGCLHESETIENREHDALTGDLVSKGTWCNGLASVGCRAGRKPTGVIGSQNLDNSDRQKNDNITLETISKQCKNQRYGTMPFDVHKK